MMNLEYCWELSVSRTSLRRFWGYKLLMREMRQSTFAPLLPDCRKKTCWINSQNKSKIGFLYLVPALAYRIDLGARKVSAGLIKQRRSGRSCKTFIYQFCNYSAGVQLWLKGLFLCQKHPIWVVTQFLSKWKSEWQELISQQLDQVLDRNRIRVEE